MSDRVAARRPPLRWNGGRVGFAGGLAWLLLAGGSGVARAADLVAIPGCTLVPTEWADGDSFRIRTPAGDEHTVRLYGADCLEAHVGSETDARRLRSQRRAFGITEVRGTAAEIGRAHV